MVAECNLCMESKILFYACYQCNNDWCHTCHRKMDTRAMRKTSLMSCPYCRCVFFRYLKFCRPVRKIKFLRSN